MSEAEIEWRPIPGYAGSYSVSNTGLVRAEARLRNGRANSVRALKQRMKVQQQREDGYLQVSLTLDSKGVHAYVHCLVALAFIGPRPEGQQACHNDGDKTNNVLSNIRYDTRTGNEADKVLHGTSNRGDRRRTAKLDAAQVKAIRSDQRLHREIARAFGVSEGYVSEIKSGKAWSWL